MVLTDSEKNDDVFAQVVDNLHIGSGFPEENLAASQEWFRIADVLWDEWQYSQRGPILAAYVHEW
jgi:hypothetical protein